MEKELLLTSLGLSEDEAKIYAILIESGGQPARLISRKSGVPRTLAYRALSKLENLGLIEKKDRKKAVSLFSPTHPNNLKNLLSQKEEKLASIKKSFTETIGIFSGQFNALAGKPNVLFYEGVQGVQKLYDDIIDTGSNLLLVRSPFDKENDQLRDLLEKQIIRQAKNNIKVKALTPLTPTTARGMRQKKPDSPGVTRCIIPKNFDIPAQVLLYGNKVGLVSLKKSLMTTIIENDDISDTFKILFEKIWELSKVESDKIKEKIELGHIA